MGTHNMAKRSANDGTAAPSRSRKDTGGAAEGGSGSGRPALSVKTNDKGQVFSHVRQKWLIETPEERVRQAYVVTLHNEYGFGLDQMDEELDVTGRGSARARADVVIWRTAQDKADSKAPLIVVECKADNVTIKPADYAQGETHALHCNAPFFVTHNNRETRYWRTRKDRMPGNVEEIENIPHANDSEKQIQELIEKPKTFRGEIGQFFIPRTIVEFMVRMVDPKEGDIVCDPGSGSGGFLIRVFDIVRQQILADADADAQYRAYAEELAGKRWSEAKRAEMLRKRYDQIQTQIDQRQSGSRTWNLSNQCIYGTDANDRMARTSKMNMILHGDGHGGVHHHNGFVNVNGVFEDRFDVVLTNPPFGANVEPSDVLTDDETTVHPDAIRRYRNEYGNLYQDAQARVEAAKAEVEAKYADEIAAETARLQAAKGAKNADARKAAHSELRDCLKRMQGTITREVRALLKEQFDYPVFLYEAEKVGITATGEPDANELYPNTNLPNGINPEDTCLELYRRFVATPEEFIEENRHG